MKQYVLRVFTILALIITFTFSVCNTSYAYTEEEKQQAKAWLSAHGYSPDAGGASQAYADYLNGKFDEELGIDVNGDGIPAAEETNENASVQDSSTEVQDSDQTDTEKDKDSEKKTKKQIPGSSEANPDNAANSNHPVNGENTTPDIANEDNETAGENEDGALEINLLDVDGDTEQEETAVLAPAQPAKLSRGLITLYRKNRMDTYKEAAEVIGIALLLTMVVQLLFTLKK